MRSIRCWRTMPLKPGFFEPTVPRQPRSHPDPHRHPHATAHAHRSQLHRPVKLPAWQRRGVYASVAVLALTGLVWLAVHFLSAQSDDGLGQGTAKLWTIRVHAAAALCTLVMVGSLLPVHIRPAWRARKNRVSGALVVGVMVVLALTGYALGYAPEGLARQWSAWSHWAVGAASPLLLLLHVLLGHRTRHRALP